MKEAKEKVLGLVERFFEDFEKEVNKSITAYNTSLKENYHNINVEISAMKSELKNKISSLETEKVLKTVIGYYSKEEEKRINENL